MASVHKPTFAIERNVEIKKNKKKKNEWHWGKKNGLVNVYYENRIQIGKK